MHDTFPTRTTQDTTSQQGVVIQLVGHMVDSHRNYKMSIKALDFGGIFFFAQAKQQ